MIDEMLREPQHDSSDEEMLREPQHDNPLKKQTTYEKLQQQHLKHLAPSTLHWYTVILIHCYIVQKSPFPKSLQTSGKSSVTHYY
ncbi:hypothetical protein SAMN05660493_02449 [Epilithonimonas bovis DSM 19482]|uniref:Uncharacterized protein n=1 Tax=Epilithonimonas bovis DSM 19482 TaxID=1121284 RepID=A0A1U7Q024_9FLAO|nr:hypothetical protein SAMN05660493_02449 [Epilithonimonas bovis DSM 19482]